MTTKGSGGNTGYYDDLEYDLNKGYVGYDGIKEIDVSEYKNSVSLTIYVNKSDWEDLDLSEMEEVLEDIYDYIYYYYDYSDVDGQIRNYSNDSLMYDFYFNNSGYAIID